jgi:hypothetical protein
VLVVPTHTSHIAPLSTPRAMAHGGSWGCCHGPTVVVASSSFHPRAVACEAGGGRCVICVVAVVAVLPPCCFPSFHLRSTPQAGACEAGGRWCVIHALLPLLSLVGCRSIIVCLLFTPSFSGFALPAVVVPLSVRRGSGDMAVCWWWHCAGRSFPVCPLIAPAIHPTSRGS